ARAAGRSAARPAGAAPAHGRAGAGRFPDVACRAGRRSGPARQVAHGQRPAVRRQRFDRAMSAPDATAQLAAYIRHIRDGRQLSAHTVEAYRRDLTQLAGFLERHFGGEAWTWAG